MRGFMMPECCRLNLERVCLGGLLLWGACGSFAGTPEATGLSYLNGLRIEAGMTSLSGNSLLDLAAANHASYSFLNNVTGHYENPGDPGFTGIGPSDRTAAVGYLSRSVSENVAYGRDTVSEAIDGLMSAIYHRFGFLSPTITEVGVGIRDVFYTFDMGNSSLRALCEGTSFSGAGAYYLDVCIDETFRIAAADYDAAIQATAESNPPVILWPPMNATDIVPVFYEEVPDPLPAHGVTGYPVSVQFNEYRVAGAVGIQAFSLYDGKGVELGYAHKVLKPSDDVNNKFSGYEAAVFPLQRLEWGRRYRAHLEYTIGGGAVETLDWQFTTRTLPNPYYRIEDELAAEREVISGKTYSIYFVPQDSNDSFSSYGISYYAGMSVAADLIDHNTIDITITGAPGDEAIFNLSNGLQITFVVAESDTAQVNAIPPDSDSDGIDDDYDNCPQAPNTDQLNTDSDAQGNVCDLDDDGDGLSDVDELDSYGTDPLKADTDSDGMDDLYEVTAGLDPTSDDAAGDKDGDGITNLAEFSAGTDPNDPNDPSSSLPPEVLLQAILPILLND